MKQSNITIIVVVACFGANGTLEFFGITLNHQLDS